MITRRSKVKTAVVYYSRTGNCEYVAKEIEKEAGCDLIGIKTVKPYRFLNGGRAALASEEPELVPYEFDAGQYDHIVFGLPVWASCVTPPIRSFISRNKEALQGKKFSVFLCYKGGGGDKVLAKLRELLGIEGFEAEMILIEPAKKPDIEKAKMIKAFAGKLR